MAKQTNWVKDFLDSSPLALFFIVLGAVVTFAVTTIDSGWRLWDRWKATSEVPTMEINRLGGFVLAPVTPAMQELPHVRLVQEISGMFRGGDSSRVPLWPVQLLVLNPTKDSVNLHSCRMRVTLPADVYAGVKTLGSVPLESSEYFFSDAIASVEARAAGKPFAVPAGEAKRVQLYFLFVLLGHLRDNPETRDNTSAFLRPPVTAVVTCRDQARREFAATSSIYGSIVPKSTQEKK